MTGIENGIAGEIMHVYRRLLQRGSQTMESLNIGVGQAPILKLLKDNGTMTQRQIAEEIRVTPATICGTIKRMERSGLIRRDAAERDGRVTCISLTEEGTHRTEAAMKALEMAHGEMLSGFTDEEKAQLLGYIVRMGQNMEQAMEAAEKDLLDENR